MSFMFVTVHVVRSTPKAVESIGFPVGTRGAIPRGLGLSRAALTAAGFEGKAVINRTDWGVAFNAALETGGLLVSEKVTLEFDISAIKLTPTA